MVAAKKVAAKRPELPEPVQLEFELERETSGTYRFKEVAEAGEEVIGPLYVKKRYFGSFYPENGLVVTVQPL